VEPVTPTLLTEVLSYRNKLLWRNQIISCINQCTLCREVFQHINNLCYKNLLYLWASVRRKSYIYVLHFPLWQGIRSYKVIPVLFLNWSSHHEGVLGSGGMAPCIRDLGSRWKWVVRFTPRPL
jgi:hypothetical protein